MLLVRVSVVALWLGSALWLHCDSLYRNPADTRRISNSSYSVYKGRCYDSRTGIVLPRNGVPKKFKHLCMRATCFRNYTMLVESCKKSTCVIPNVKYTRNYPHCCPEVICKNGHRVRYLLTNETVASIPTRRPWPTKRRVGKGRRRKTNRKDCQEQSADGTEGRKCNANEKRHNVTSTTTDVPE